MMKPKNIIKEKYIFDETGRLLYYYGTVKGLSLLVKKEMAMLESETARPTAQYT